MGFDLNRSVAAGVGLWLLAGLAFASSSATDVAPRGWLEVEDPGCVEGAKSPATTHWENGQRAVHRLTLWLSAQENIAPGPIEIDVTGKWVAAWVPVHTEVPADAAQTTTCLRHVTLTLKVAPLPEADYVWVLRRGSRATDEPVYRKLLEIARARAVAEAEAEAGAAPSSPPSASNGN